MFCFSVSAETTSVENSLTEIKKIEILKEHNRKLAKIRPLEYTPDIAPASITNTKSTFEQKLEVQADTVEALKSLGYDAYDVNPQTFETVESILNTDLTAAGLKKDNAYIITLNEERSIYPNATVSESFDHTYNGNKYTLRWMTVRYTDDPSFEKYSEKNVINDNTRDVIVNFLDAALGIYVGAIWSPLGTVASLLNLSISDFWVSYNAYFNYNATSTWVRRYTQVWSDYDQTWAFGCYVEQVEAASYLNGWYYDSATHTKKQLVTPTEYKYIDSSKYNDYEWRKNYAVIGYLNSTIQTNITGDVKYYYDGDVIFTHKHNF